MANFRDAIKLTAINEGGYQNLLSDPGNKNSKGLYVGTNFGISAPVYEAWIKRVPTIQDMKNITKQESELIYKTWYWDKLKLDQLPDQYLANHLFDISLNGINSATKIIQRSINDLGKYKLLVDGVYGPNTQKALSDTLKDGKARELNQALVNRRISFYKSDGNPDFLTGWITRANKYLNYSNIVKVGLPIGFFLPLVY